MRGEEGHIEQIRRHHQPSCMSKLRTVAGEDKDGSWFRTDSWLCCCQTSRSLSHHEATFSFVGRHKEQNAGGDIDTLLKPCPGICLHELMFEQLRVLSRLSCLLVSNDNQKHHGPYLCQPWLNAPQMHK